MIYISVSENIILNQNLFILNNIITHSRTGFSEYIKNDVFANILPSYIYAVLITVIIYVSDEVESYRDTKPADFLYVIMIIFVPLEHRIWDTN